MAWENSPKHDVYAILNMALELKILNNERPFL